MLACCLGWHGCHSSLFSAWLVVALLLVRDVVCSLLVYRLAIFRCNFMQVRLLHVRQPSPPATGAPQPELLSSPCRAAAARSSRGHQSMCLCRRADRFVLSWIRLFCRGVVRVSGCRRCHRRRCRRRLLSCGCGFGWYCLCCCSCLSCA